MNLNISQLDVCKILDYIPVVGFFKNGITLLAKGIFSIMNNTPLANSGGSFQAYVIGASILRCAVIVCVNVVGIGMTFLIYKKLQTKQNNFFEDTKTLQSLPNLDANKVINGDNNGEYPIIHFKNMTDPIMQGITSDKRKFLAFRLRVTATPQAYNVLEDEICLMLKKDINQNHIENRVMILFQRESRIQNDWTMSFPGLSYSGSFPFFTSTFNFNITEGRIRYENYDKKGFIRFNQLLEGKIVSHEGCSYQLVQN